MGFRLDFDEANRVLRMSFAGRLSDEDLLAGYPALRAAKARCGPCPCIIDYTAVTTAAEVSSATIRTVVNMPPSGPGDLLQVNVAPSDLVFGMARMFQTLSSETRPNLHVVRTMDEAYRLLGVQSVRFLPLAGDQDERPEPD